MHSMFIHKKNGNHLKFKLCLTNNHKFIEIRYTVDQLQVVILYFIHKYNYGL